MDNKKTIGLSVGAIVIAFIALILTFTSGGKTITERIIEKGVGGISDLDILDINFLSLGKTSSTTDSIYTFYQRGSITGSQDSSRWFNDTNADVFLTDFRLLTNPSAVATGTFIIVSGSSTRPRIFTYSASPHPYLSGANLASGVSSSTRLFFKSIATSTSGHLFTATTSKQTLTPTAISDDAGVFLKIRRNDFLVVELYAQSGNCSAAGAATGAAGNKGKCEEATSTNTGIKPIVWWATFMSTTSKETF